MKIIALDSVAEPYRAPDLIWDGVVGDLAINPLTHPDAPGDLRAGQGLATQVLICLMTDARVEDSELPDGVENRGWPGDSFDLEEGERPLGSKLWLLRNRALTEGIEIEIEDYVRDALATLIDQGAVASIDVGVTVDRPGNRADFQVSLYARSGSGSGPRSGLGSGQSVYQGKFQVLWEQVNGVAYPLRG